MYNMGKYGFYYYNTPLNTEFVIKYQKNIGPSNKA